MGYGLPHNHIDATRAGIALIVGLVHGLVAVPLLFAAAILMVISLRKFTGALEQSTIRLDAIRDQYVNDDLTALVELHSDLSGLATNVQDHLKDHARKEHKVMLAVDEIIDLFDAHQGEHPAIDEAMRRIQIAVKSDSDDGQPAPIVQPPNHGAPGDQPPEEQ